ncbi:MAG: LPS assembly lipoprotein LptE [Myxococcota bacterium]
MSLTFRMPRGRPGRARAKTTAGAAPLLCLALLALPVAGCGVHFVERSDAIPENLKTVAIPLWENQTSEPGLDTIFTNAAVKEFSTKGWLKPASMEGADTILEGRIELIDIQPLSFSSVAIELENRISVTASVTLRRSDDRSILWSSSRLVGEEEYDTTPDFNVNLRNREQALRKLAIDMAGTVHDAIFRVY